MAKDVTHHLTDGQVKALSYIENEIKKLQKQAEDLEKSSPIDSKIIMTDIHILTQSKTVWEALYLGENLDGDILNLIGRVIDNFDHVLDKLPEIKDTSDLKEDLDSLKGHKNELEWLHRRLQEEGHTSKD